MPVNAGYEYGQAQKKFQEARTDDERIAALEEMLSTVPAHKGTEVLRMELKGKLSKLRKKQESARSKRAKRQSIFVKREGAARVVLIGLPNSGKSYILSKITNAKPLIAEYEFTTRKPEVGIMNYEGIKIQIIEVPAFFQGFYESSTGPMYMSFIRDTDLVVIVVDGKKNPEDTLNIIMNEIRKAWIKFDYDKIIVIVNKEFKYLNSVFKTTSLENAKELIWERLNLVYVYTKSPGKPKEFPPVALKKGSTVKDLALEVHKDFLTNFNYARIWGKSVKHNGSTVGLDHVLGSADVVEFHMK
jgi:small GTP-binding protein